MENYIHPTAIVPPTVVMGFGNYIGPYAVLGQEVVLGDNNYIGPHCIIGDKGESVKFFQERNFGVIIGNNNRFTKQVTIDGGTVGATKIQDRTLWLKNAHCGHDSLIETDVQVRCNAIVGGHCYIKVGAKLMLNSIVHPRLVIPQNAVIGMGAVVVKKSQGILEANGIYVGNPIRQLQKNDG
jgi:UDP-N-acetylglucosamine acyltransferase